MRASQRILQFCVSVALTAPAVGCAGSVRDQIQSPDPAARVRAIIKATQWCDRKAIPLIVDRLEDEDEAVRTMANMALKKLTGQDFGYRAYDSIARRQRSVATWRQWLRERRISGGKNPASRPDR